MITMDSMDKYSTPSSGCHIDLCWPSFWPLLFRMLVVLVDIVSETLLLTYTFMFLYLESILILCSVV